MKILIYLKRKIFIHNFWVLWKIGNWGLFAIILKWRKERTHWHRDEKTRNMWYIERAQLYWKWKEQGGGKYMSAWSKKWKKKKKKKKKITKQQQQQQQLLLLWSTATTAPNSIGYLLTIITTYHHSTMVREQTLSSHNQWLQQWWQW